MIIALIHVLFKTKVCVLSINTCTIIRQHFTKQGMNDNTHVEMKALNPLLLPF